MATIHEVRDFIEECRLQTEGLFKDIDLMFKTTGAIDIYNITDGDRFDFALIQKACLRIGNKIKYATLCANVDNLCEMLEEAEAAKKKMESLS